MLFHFSKRFLAFSLKLLTTAAFCAVRVENVWNESHVFKKWKEFNRDTTHCPSVGHSFQLKPLLDHIPRIKIQF